MDAVYNTCSKCSELKSEDNFNFRDKIKGLRHKHCSSCQKLFAKAWRVVNKDKKKATDKHYRELNNAKILEYNKLYKEANRDILNQKLREYRKTLEGKLTQKISSTKRRALKTSTADGTITKGSLQNLIEMQNYCCAYCNCDINLIESNKAHLDHIIPLSKGGMHSINNVVWSCPLCNLQKSDKIIGGNYELV